MKVRPRPVELLQAAFAPNDEFPNHNDERITKLEYASGWHINHLVI
jgi:hypothetical protein